MPLICRRCLLADMEEERPLHLLMREWLDSMPEEHKAAPEIYLARLSACATCDELMNGMCRLCGCYVELRAAKANQRCPNAPSKWGAIDHNVRAQDLC